MKNPGVKRKLPALASAVGMISVLTLLSRFFGFGRWLTQSAWVGTGAFANAYSTANQLPTVLFEVVAGGALAGVTIPSWLARLQIRCIKMCSGYRLP